MQWPQEKGQTRIYTISHRKLKIEQRELHLKLGVNSGAPERKGLQFLLLDYESTNFYC